MKLHIEVPAFAEKLLRRVAARENKSPQAWIHDALLGLLQNPRDLRIVQDRLRRDDSSRDPEAP